MNQVLSKQSMSTFFETPGIILLATNTVQNCLYYPSKAKNEKSNIVNRWGILLRIIM